MTVYLFAASPQPAGWGWLAAACGIASGLLLNAGIALAAAANQVRWHSGGFRGSKLLLIWHAAWCGVCLAAGHCAGVTMEPWAVFALAAMSFQTVFYLVVVFALNAADCLIALSDLLQQNERVNPPRIYR